MRNLITILFMFNVMLKATFKHPGSSISVFHDFIWTSESDRSPGASGEV